MSLNASRSNSKSQLGKPRLSHADRRNASTSCSPDGAVVIRTSRRRRGVDRPLRRWTGLRRVGRRVGDLKQVVKLGAYSKDHSGMAPGKVKASGVVRIISGSRHPAAGWAGRRWGVCHNPTRSQRLSPFDLRDGFFGTTGRAVSPNPWVAAAHAVFPIFSKPQPGGGWAGL